MEHKSILNRRFVRLKAIQNLYAFYICKQASYQCTLDQIRAIWAFDSFAEQTLDKQQQLIYQDQALDLFTCLVKPSATPEVSMLTYPMPVQIAVQQSRIDYEEDINKEIKKLLSSWHLTIDKIQKSALLILALFIEWEHLVKQQVDKIRFYEQSGFDWPKSLAQNQILDNLKKNQHFNQLIQQHNLTWSNHLDLVANWYNSFIKKNTTLHLEVDAPATVIQEKVFLENILQKVIFKEQAIEDFFSDLDLSWLAHKPIVKKILVYCLESLQENKEENTSLAFWEIGSELEAANFYNLLITHILAQDQVLEDIIQQHIKNWSIERVVLLDKVILKLALVEMLHLTSIPFKVSMNEYIDLSKMYSTPKSRLFINGILDAVAKTLP